MVWITNPQARIILKLDEASGEYVLQAVVSGEAGKVERFNDFIAFSDRVRALEGALTRRHDRVH